MQIESKSITCIQHSKLESQTEKFPCIPKSKYKIQLIENNMSWTRKLRQNPFSASSSCASSW
jgi:hypothetical protein